MRLKPGSVASDWRYRSKKAPRLCFITFSLRQSEPPTMFEIGALMYRQQGNDARPKPGRRFQSAGASRPQILQPRRPRFSGHLAPVGLAHDAREIGRQRYGLLLRHMSHLQLEVLGRQLPDHHSLAEKARRYHALP